MRGFERVQLMSMAKTGRRGHVEVQDEKRGDTRRQRKAGLSQAEEPPWRNTAKSQSGEMARCTWRNCAHPGRHGQRGQGRRMTRQEGSGKSPLPRRHLLGRTRQFRLLLTTGEHALNNFLKFCKYNFRVYLDE